MNQNIQTINQMRAITISREYGSGGGEIATRLASHLKWQLIDHEIVERVASEMGTSIEEAEAYEERTEGIIARVFKNMQFLALYVVIVGRVSQMLLEQQRDVLHVRIIAPFEKRVDYVMKREGIDQAAAESRIKMKDYDRMKHLETAFHRKPEDAHLYDIVLSTSFLDLDSAVEIISLTLQQKANQLSVKIGELGPAVGLPPYPDKPEDFRPKVG
jgi:cytidylate kinase